MGNTPNIRFKGFTNDWEQRKLGDEAIEILAGGDIDKEKVAENGKYPIYANALTNDGIVGYYNDYFRVKAPAVTVTGRGEVGHAQARMTDFTPVVRLLAIRSNHDCYFLENAINNHKVVVESTGVPQLTVPQLSSYKLYFPKEIEEETKIGKYFHNLDHLITLHQRKCDETKELKKFMLQKMFPKNGEKKPEIRFEGFTDDWEQRKLGEVFEEYSEKNHEELPPLTIIQGGGTILREESDRALQYDKSSLSGYKMVKKNDFIVHLRSFEGGLEKANTDGIISPAYHTFHGENTDSRFYYPFFRSKRFIDTLLKPHVYGIRDGKSIDIEGMKSIMIPVPSYKEQQAIGGYIETLDHLITLHQRKCDEIKEIKKFMLQNMFPQKG